ncbi:hypothetical protein LAV79_05330 [Peribacillus butanolivorans]|uniref:hypothetical protein n=1 Tax=Peribacillus butanolivorans TaxID=421767 RepID=UPI0030C9C916
MRPEDYLELVAIAKEHLEGQAILDALEGVESDIDFIEKQHRRIEEYNRKITELTKG